MQLPEGPSDDRHAWAEAVGVHGEEVYRDDVNDYDTQLQLARLQQMAQREMARGWLPLLWIYLLFLVRLGGWLEERPEAWHETMLVAIPKKTFKVGFRAVRYISLLPVLQKFHVRARETNIVGVGPGRSTAGVPAR